MGKWIKSVVLAVVILLAVSTLIDAWRPGMNLEAVISGKAFWRLAVLLALAAMVFWGWLALKRFEASQRYRRAEQVEQEAREQAQRSKEACQLMEQRLHADVQARLQEMEQQVRRKEAELAGQLKAVKKQNVELKETVASLMGALKKEKERASGGRRA